MGMTSRVIALSFYAFGRKLYAVHLGFCILPVIFNSQRFTTYFSVSRYGRGPFVFRSF